MTWWGKNYILFSLTTHQNLAFSLSIGVNVGLAVCFGFTTNEAQILVRLMTVAARNISRVHEYFINAGIVRPEATSYLKCQ